jgi:hypothetical protein
MICLKNLRVTVRGIPHPIPITESPIYQSLASHNAAIYENYIKDNNIKTSRTWARYQDTYHHIKEHGFNATQEPRIQVNSQNVVTNGHHRVSILYVLFGGNLKVTITRGQVSAIH